VTIKLSVTSKLDGIKSWSLNALETCPGSMSSKGELVPACAGCYATTGHYRFKNVKAPREHNRQDWQRPDWVGDMVTALDTERYFRWFDSGDMYSLDLARKILAVMRATPHVKHWLPTRMHKFPKFKGTLDKMRALPNVALRPSSDSVTGQFVPGLHGSTIIASREAAPTSVKICEAYDHGGKCSGCRACWDKTVPVIAYVAHGRKVRKTLRIHAV
jgi:hypothetical protein